MALFIASDQPLPLIEWQESEPAFNVQRMSDGEEGVRRHFSKPNVYYLGAHTGCSCGFKYGQIEIGEHDEADEAAGRESVSALRRYASEAVQRLGEVELFSSWEGDWNDAAERRLDVTPEWFDGESFKLPEKVAFRVSRPPSLEGAT
jgi:hypothetical protein